MFAIFFSKFINIKNKDQNERQNLSFLFISHSKFSFHSSKQLSYSTFSFHFFNLLRLAFQILLSRAIFYPHFLTQSLNFIFPLSYSAYVNSILYFLYLFSQSTYWINILTWFLTLSSLSAFLVHILIVMSLPNFSL